MVVIGIDPDSDRSGVSTYFYGKLDRLESLSLWEIYAYLEGINDIYEEIEVHIEDLISVSAAFNARDKNANIHVKLKMAQSIGMCKQAQKEIESLCELLGIKVIKHKISKMWKKDKSTFEKITGWKGRSNEDTRSAAYFGWLGLKNTNKSLKI